MPLRKSWSREGIQLMSLMLLALLAGQPVATKQRYGCELKDAVQRYMELRRSGDSEALLKCYDDRSWNIIAKSRFRDHLEADKLHYMTTDSWTIAKIAIESNVAFTRLETESRVMGSAVKHEEGVQWVREGGRWKITLDAWNARKRDSQLWAEHGQIVTLNSVDEEPKGAYRELAVQRTVEAVSLLSGKRWDRLSAMSSTVTLLNGLTSWDLEHTLDQQWRQGWSIPGLNAQEVSVNSVEWRPWSIELYDPVRPVVDGNLNVCAKLSCWEVFVPFTSRPAYCDEKCGALYRWGRVPGGIRLFQVAPIGCPII